MSDWSYVNTKASYYSGKGIKFLGIPAIDLKHYPLNLHFKGKKGIKRGQWTYSRIEM
jgi:hypothetical protein